MASSKKKSKNTKVTKKKTVKKKVLRKKKFESNNTLTESDEFNLSYHAALKLQIELVPRSCFWSNVRKCVTAKQWNEIRHDVYRMADNKCEICGGQGTRHPVECHEVWVYDDKNSIQRLDHFQALCPMCHEVKHIGLAGVRGYGDRATQRFIDINEIELKSEHVNSIISSVWKQWALRSEREWKLDIDYIRRYGFDPQTLKDNYDKKLQSKKVSRDEAPSW